MKQELIETSIGDFMMKKFVMFGTLFVLSFSINAKVQKASEESLNDDLNFRLDQSSDYDRDVASEESSQDEKNENESERDVASENENLDAPIQYWKY